MRKYSFMVNAVLMSMLTAATTVGFTSCSDELNAETEALTEDSTTRAIFSNNYNINDHRVKINDKTCNAFNREIWWAEKSIFLHTGDLNESSQVKAETTPGLFFEKKGFQLKNLPWCDDAKSYCYIPESVWKEMVNDHDNWKLVMMQCGNTSTQNGNYLGFYNKYTGTLRIMAYLKAGGSDKTHHLWGIEMSDQMAAHSTFGYAVPVDRSDNIAKAKEVYKMGEHYSNIVTPLFNKTVWDDSEKISPRDGWWAFDIDLSVYRNNSAGDLTKTESNSGMLSIHPLGFNEIDVNIQTGIDAMVNGEINMETCQASTDGGVFGKIVDVASKVAGFAKNIVGGDPLEALNSGIELAKTGCDVLGIDTDEKKQGGYKGTANMKITGKMSSVGSLSSKTHFDKMEAVTLTPNCFDTKDNTFGQGVWNLETAPVVYYTNAETRWLVQSGDDGNDSWINYWAEKKSPFGGNRCGNGGSKNPWHGLVCFFDPSSIKLALNPKVFTKEQIESAKVSAVCGVRKATSDYEVNKQHREAQGLCSPMVHVDTTYPFTNRYTGEAAFNAFSGYTKENDNIKNYKFSKFETGSAEGNKTGVMGMGDEDFIVEPVALRGQDDTKWGYYYLPAYEVTVTVSIELEEGKNIVFSRTYLPEYKFLDGMNIQREFDRIKNACPTYYASEVFYQQSEHIGHLNHWFRATPIAYYGTPQQLVYTVRWRQVVNHNSITNSMSEKDSDQGSFSVALDGDVTTTWWSHKSNRKENAWYCNNTKTVRKGCDYHCWFVEFKTYGKMKAKSFTLYNSKNAGKKVPRDISLFAKNSNGEWVLLYTKDTCGLPKSSLSSMTFNIDNPGWYDTYRFEAGANWGDNYMDLNEIVLNY